VTTFGASASAKPDEARREAIAAMAIRFIIVS
jgi:hypothetical protein